MALTGTGFFTGIEGDTASSAGGAMEGTGFWLSSRSTTGSSALGLGWISDSKSGADVGFLGDREEPSGIAVVVEGNPCGGRFCDSYGFS